MLSEDLDLLLSWQHLDWNPRLPLEDPEWQLRSKQTESPVKMLSEGPELRLRLLPKELLLNQLSDVQELRPRFWRKALCAAQELRLS